MPQASTATRDDLLSSGPDSSSSDDESIPFNRNFRDDLLDARRPIRVRDSGSDSSSSEDKGDDEVKDSQPESQSQVAGARSFRARASLPNYNLKQLSSVRTLTKKGARKGSKFVDEESASSEDGDELGATTIDLGQLQYDEMKPLRTCGDRLYNEWIGTLNGRKVRVAGAGALFPKDYQPLPDVERPWVCAVRACKRTFVSTTGLGGHFNMAHRACLLNDNGDATMTVIGRRQNPEATGRYPAVVVSAVPLPDNRKTVVLGPNDPPNGKRYRQVLDPNASWAAASQSPLWRYLRTILPNTVTLPKYAPALELLALPQRRLLPDSVQDRFRDGLVDMEVDVRIVCAILLYLTGARGLCNNCSDPKGAASNMFDMCVALRPSASAALKKTFGPSTCCNCYLGGLMRPCVMVRSNLPDTESLEQVNGLDLPEAPKEELSQLPDEKEEEVVERRWSSRLMTLNSARASTRTSLSRENSTVKPTLVTPVPIPTFGQTALRKPAAAAAAGPATSAVVAPPDINNLAASLELEDWEFAPGRIRDEGEGEEGPENIAFSTAFVSQNQTVAVAPDVTFRVQMVKPGECARFTADPDRLRICSVASGKVRVKGLVAGQDFAVGPNGVWKIKGGAACVVENRLYLDAVVHVSSVPCYDL
ncbi:hypothetical protein QBC33DRAFT_564041 [Phialemonium atrogriseum]|uniref:C2H2-type domain-containing protein n=1 Tax=Phialemonium atrogriseum TaxID=1093897 RepID=A0AAJ0BUG0_9PEZI|nr:uncharacterized protein QBC33DRAFT_564041 [Phialemonium atrogriseum]KAK1762216.1 hypothetical protein QBC33DRAFT_564041 [Phialemonium atrogriseum]